MDEQGSAAVIGTVFPELSGGIAAAAFHGLIRLAYGIEADHAGEMAAGLAILCASATDFDGHIETAPPVASVEDAFSRLSDAYAGKTISGKMIVDRMRSAAGAPQFAEALSWPAIEPGRLRSELADAGLRLYWQTGDFTVLHLVTSVHALCVLFDRFPQLAALETMRAMWTAVCAAYASVGAPSLEAKALSGQTPPWTDIFQGAIASNDDHVIKMTYSCHCQQCRYGDRLYQAAAARLVAAGKA
jgi:hypothetical protein